MDSKVMSLCFFLLKVDKKFSPLLEKHCQLTLLKRKMIYSIKELFPDRVFASQILEDAPCIFPFQ